MTAATAVQPGLLAPDLASPAFKANPHPFYARLRAEAPVYRVTTGRLGKRGAWLITRYADVQSVLKDPRFTKNPRSHVLAEGAGRQPWSPAFLRPLERNMLDLDPPDQTRLRALVHKAFTPRLVEQLRQRVQSLCDGLLDAAASRGRLELVSEYALPVPSTIIAQLLGVPPEDRHKFHGWSKRIVSIATPRDLLLALPYALLFLRYMRGLIARRREQPGEDLISALVQAEEAGDRMDMDELLGMVFLLLVAGHETTVNLISSGMLALLQHPDQLARLRAEPALIGSAIEELLRYVSPLEVATERYAREDLDVAGSRIRRGEVALPVIGSANRDERQFAEPDVLDLAREPNPHVAFGLGIHYCLGSPLARLEGQIAVGALVRRFPNLRLAQPAEAVRWRRGIFIRGPERVPLLST
jgi:cytochrome P450